MKEWQEPKGYEVRQHRYEQITSTRPDWEILIPLTETKFQNPIYILRFHTHKIIFSYVQSSRPVRLSYYSCH
jgi:hypothetical protein